MRVIVILFICVIHCCSDTLAQFTTKVDVVPYAESCDIHDDLEDAVRCSEGLLLDYFLRSVDTLACPNTDTSHQVNVSLVVDEMGYYTAKVRSGQLEEDCMAHFQEKAFAMPSQISLFPALLEKKDIAYNKHLLFYYPPINYDGLIQEDFENCTTQPEELPRFRGCEDMIGGAEDKNSCSKSLMLRAIYSTLRYPADARERGIEGMVVAKFIVGKKGFISNIEIEKSVAGGCDQAVRDVLERLNDLDEPPFIPGKVKGKPVNVEYKIPVKFRLG